MGEQKQNDNHILILEKFSDLADWVGKELGVSPWHIVNQETIDTFARITDDQQWIHTDTEKATRFSPYGSTIAHGFLILSFASKFARETHRIKNRGVGINYGLDRVRFPNAVKVDAFIRGRARLMAYQNLENGARYKLHVTIEIQGQEKPACVAEWIVLALNIL